MPTPRLMNNLPFCASLSKWRAMTEVIRSFACCSSMVCISAFPYGQDVDIDVRRHDAFRIERSHRHDLINFCNNCVCRHGHDGVEVSSGLVVDQITQLVRFIGLDQRHVGMDGFFQDTRPPGKFSGLLACGEVCSRTSRCEERRDPHSGGSDRFCKRPLRNQFHGDPTFVVGARHLWIPVVVGPDQRPDLVVGEQLAKAHAGRTQVVADDRQVTRPTCCKCLDQLLGVSGQAKAPDHDTCPWLDLAIAFSMLLYLSLTMDRTSCSHTHRFSKIVDTPRPPATQMVASPYLVFLRNISWISVTEMRVPEQPSGCPSAMAPPFTLRISRLKLNSLTTARL